MTRLLFGLLVAAPLAGWSQSDDDAPIPYEDEDDAPAEVRHRSKRPVEGLREEEDETSEYNVRTGHLDDPNIGLSGELLAGAMLFESARGALVDPRFMFGVRFTWEYGRLLSDEFLREVFFADITWQFAATGDGTTEVRSDATYHYFTVAPAFALRLGTSPVAAFAQVGAGFNYGFSSLRVGSQVTTVEGVKFLFQYGLGLRFRPAIVVVKGKELLRLSFRVEVTRFVRGYMQDTFLGGSVGLTF
jgi:hypothetical protein